MEPHCVAALSQGRSITLVSGTNGKTTSTALAVAALGERQDVATNHDGSNTASAVAGVLATSDAPRVVLEVDEGWLPWAIQETRPEAVVLTNLSRDQLSRHHEVGAIARSWRQALAETPLVIANADDPGVTWAALAARRQVWVGVGGAWRNDSHVCPSCGDRCVAAEPAAPPRWACRGCGLARPQAEWEIQGHTLRGLGQEIDLTLGLPGRFNIANAAMATAAAATIDGVPMDQAAERLRSVSSVAGRFRQVRVHGHDLRVMLAKNPAGWLEILQLVNENRNPVVLAFNAEGVDGRDPSWLYDVDFTPLRGRTVKVQGHRATDLLVRLDHDDVAAEPVPGPLAAALWRLPAGAVDVIANYSAFRRIVQELRCG
jgi:UDP-N-acetylmuramyl tripeptide synthase